MMPMNHTLFDLLDKTKSVTGEVAECGVFRGRTLLSRAMSGGKAAPVRRNERGKCRGQ